MHWPMTSLVVDWKTTLYARVSQWTQQQQGKRIWRLLLSYISRSERSLVMLEWRNLKLLSIQWQKRAGFFYSQHMDCDDSRRENIFAPTIGQAKNRKWFLATQKILHFCLKSLAIDLCKKWWKALQILLWVSMDNGEHALWKRNGSNGTGGKESLAPVWRGVWLWTDHLQELSMFCASPDGDARRGTTCTCTGNQVPNVWP